ncbi:hypothetical protein [Streptomyces sp. NBC_00038]|uniref:T4 family baseplate hub assembly chaperone n=1 Tax=Streptomyces sp. NBC_00038 TaxID=2903615 RepID=UPI00225AB3DD|nr:hypothetical protein [Streptomyces sp. NBC_00038]MCX5555778.1 hypothetical protein [Streptomyces sp. NBC_00038]
MAITQATELLATWEAGLDRTFDGRALLLHHAARPDTGGDSEALLSLPVGAREADLFALRRSLFGERMQVRLECESCGADMEFDLDAGEFARSLRVPEAAPVRIAEDGWVVEFRVPNVADLTAAARHADARRALLARCVVSVVRDGEVAPGRVPRGVAGGVPRGVADAARHGVADGVPHGADDGVPPGVPRGGALVDVLPPSVQRRIAEAAEAADPAADVTLNINCPECGTATRAELDIASYLWTELDAWARDLLLDVHLLATAYGWSEPEILALSPLRRRYYLELCADV